MDKLNEDEILTLIAALKQFRGQVKDFENRWPHLLYDNAYENFNTRINAKLEGLRNKLAVVRGE